MWTERDKILTQTQEICAYLKEVEHFHDYVIGNLEYDGKTLGVVIEEDFLKTDRSNAPAMQWYMEFQGIEMIGFHCDCVFKFGLDEVVYEEGDFVLYGHAFGCIEVRAKQVRLETPKIQRETERGGRAQYESSS